MIEQIIEDTERKMQKSIDALGRALAKIRTGRAHSELLDGVLVTCYGSSMPLNQVASVSVLDNRTLSVSPWDPKLVPDIEKAILASGLGLNPVSVGDLVRVPLADLTEETRRDYVRHARQETENARVSVRNLRRDANSHLKSKLVEKEITEDDARKAQDRVQKLTDQLIDEINKILQKKEEALLEV